MRDWLKKSRKEKGVLAKTVAAALGMKKSAYSLMELGHTFPTLPAGMIVKIAGVLGLDPAWILAQETAEPAPEGKEDTHEDGEHD